MSLNPSIPFSPWLLPMLLISPFSLVFLGVLPRVGSALLCRTPHVAIIICFPFWCAFTAFKHHLPFMVTSYHTWLLLSALRCFLLFCLSVSQNKLLFKVCSLLYKMPLVWVCSLISFMQSSVVSSPILKGNCPLRDFSCACSCFTLFFPLICMQLDLELSSIHI